MKKTKQLREFMAVVTHDHETGLYIGDIPDVPGAHSQAETLDELQENLKEVLTLCLEELNDDEVVSLPKFIGIQQISLQTD